METKPKPLPQQDETIPKETKIDSASNIPPKRKSPLGSKEYFYETIV